MKYCSGGFHGSDNLFTNMQVGERAHFQKDFYLDLDTINFVDESFVPSRC